MKFSRSVAKPEVVIMVKKRLSKRLFLRGDNSPELTNTQNEVLHLLNEGLSPRQIGIRRGTSRQAVYRITGQLKKMGRYNPIIPQETMVANCRCGRQPSNMKGPAVRLHGQEFNVKILHKGNRFKDHPGKVINIEGNTVRVYRDSLEIYGTASFIASNEHKATAESMAYWSRFFRKLENDLNVILVKSRKQNITLVKSHYAEINNEMARDCEVNNKKVQIFARDDGKLWFLIDNSFNFWEAETVHTQTSKQDMTVVRKQLNDWRDNDPPTSSELHFNQVKLERDYYKTQYEALKKSNSSKGEFQIVDLLSESSTYLEYQNEMDEGTQTELSVNPTPRSKAQAGPCRP
jgi:DNA-binding CsgD family transcriptional regulator